MSQLTRIAPSADHVPFNIFAHKLHMHATGNFECSLSTLQNNRLLVAGYSGISQSLCLTLKCNDIIQSEHNFKPMQINTIIFINNLDVNECERFE